MYTALLINTADILPLRICQSFILLACFVTHIGCLGAVQLCSRSGLHLVHNTAAATIMAFGFPFVGYIDNSVEQKVRVWHADCNDKPEQRGQTLLGTPHLHICHLLVCV